MNVDLRKADGKNHARLTLDIDGLANTIVFKSGGITQPPETAHCAAGGGLVYKGLYDAWQIEGEVTVSRDMARWLLQAYQNRSSADKISAVYEIYSTTDRLTVKHTFNNAGVSFLPHINLDELGGEVSLQVGFSLNDHVNTEIIDH